MGANINKGTDITWRRSHRALWACSVCALNVFRLWRFGKGLGAGPSRAPLGPLLHLAKEGGEGGGGRRRGGGRGGGGGARTTHIYAGANAHF
eukprot:7226589-Pyramimonas_sp.AAC.1